MNRLQYSPEALNDLDEIWTYIFKELKNPIAAQNTVDGVMDAIEKLKDFSEIGVPLSSVTEIESDYRFLVCKNYLIFYYVNGEEVRVVRILYGGRDYLRILFGDA